MRERIEMLLYVCCSLWTSFHFEVESRAVVPPFMMICRKTDQHINDCVRNSLQHILPSLRNGVADLDVPPIDPLSLAELTLSLGEGEVNLKMTLTEVIVRGLSQAEVMSVKTNVEDGKFEISTRTPELEFTGQYFAEGGVHSLPLSGQGSFNVTLDDVTSVWMVYYHETETVVTPERLSSAANGSAVGPGRAMEVDAFTMDLMPSKASYYFDHFLDGDNGLGKAVNSFLNENAHEVFNDIKGQLLEQLGKAFADIANSLLFNFREDQVWNN
ncbi:protein takeout-like [Hetaerina americana]|uniref:protein takeout-like n=1 Tax=Hetaerina americana TaxID=62018 RepID=UPI003A7F31E4